MTWKPRWSKTLLLYPTYGQLSDTETRWSINSICKRHQTLSRFSCEGLALEDYPDQRRIVHGFCIRLWYFLCNNWVNNQTLTEYWTYSLLCCNWFLARTWWMTIYTCCIWCQSVLAIYLSDDIVWLKLGLYSTPQRVVTDARYKNQSSAIAVQWNSYVRWQISTPSVVSCVCILALQSLESDHLERLQSKPDFTALSHEDRSSNNGLDSCADSWPPEIHILWRMGSSHKHSLELIVTKCAIWHRQLFRCTAIT